MAGFRAVSYAFWELAAQPTAVMVGRQVKIDAAVDWGLLPARSRPGERSAAGRDLGRRRRWEYDDLLAWRFFVRNRPGSRFARGRDDGYTLV